jgi:ABC-type transporter Mla subunit MlaD
MDCRKQLEKPMRKASVILLTLLWAVVAVGYQPDMFRIHVQFEHIYKLQEGNRVVSATKTIGVVKRLAYVKEGYFKATLAIENGCEADISEYSRFIIIDDPDVTDKRAVRVIQIRRGGKPIENGTLIEGSDKYSVLFEQMTGDMRDGVDVLKKAANELSEEFKDLAEDEKVEALKKELQQLAEAMKKATKETQDKIQKEILPQLKKEMEKLRDQLRNLGRENEMVPLDDEMKKIHSI